jgi:hypothetical protein
MDLRNKLIATIAGLCMGFSGMAIANVAPPVNLTITNAASTPGSLVSPTISFDIGGFLYEAFDLTFSYQASALTFKPQLSSVSYNGVPGPFTGLPAYLPGVASVTGDVATVSFSSFAAVGFTVNTPLLLTAVFQINNAALAAPYDISISGSVSTDPDFEERSFSGLATVTAVPEPEVWMLMLGGLGLVAWKRRPRLPK